MDENAPWVKDKPQGNHRMPKAWVEQRYSFLDEQGKPLEAIWENCGAGVRQVEDLEDITAHGPLGSKAMLECCKEVCPDGIEEPHIVLECDIDVSEKLPHEPGSLLHWRAILQSRRRVAVDKHLSSQRLLDRAALKAEQRQKIKQSLKVLLPAWREKMRA